MRPLLVVAALIVQPWLIVLVGGHGHSTPAAHAPDPGRREADDAEDRPMRVDIVDDGGLSFEGVPLPIDPLDGWRLGSLEEKLVDNRQHACGLVQSYRDPPHVVDLHVSARAPQPIVAQVLLTIASTGIDDVRIAWALLR